MEKDNYILDYFYCTKNCNVIKQISVYDWFNCIKEGEYSDLILKARNGELDYDTTKTEQLPCVVYNFNFNGYKNKSNIVAPTGLLYVDIDAPDFKIENVNKSDIFAYYKSFGGKGYSIVIRVDGLTEDNFNETYAYVCSKLEISNYVDLGAKKTTQFNVLSYDENLYLNTKSKIFKSINLSPLCEINKKKKAYSTQWGENGNNVRFDNRADYLENEESVIKNIEGFDFIQAKLLYKKVSKNRNNILLAYCTNLVWLNPNIYEDRLHAIMTAVNFNNFTNPVDEPQLQRIISSILKYKKEGTLRPTGVIKRKALFGKYCGLSKNEKLAVCREVSSESKEKASREKIQNILDCWDFVKLGKITQQSIYKNHNISKKTIEKYYKDYKKEIEMLNKTCKV
jgi:predicted transcriptional regulator